MKEITNFIFPFNPRVFKVGDRVKIYFKDKWWKGIIDHFTPAREEMFKVWFNSFLKKDPKIEIVGEGISCGLKSVIYNDYHNARMHIKTDEKVDDEDGALFDGYGIRSSWGGKDILFEDELEYIPKPEFIFLDETSEENYEGDDLPF
ncbi:MAG: hypothetical protein WC603_03610 [Candidatus Paceibacterota bacterium]|jgi:hypothetical protein